ncbi:MAG: 16S rRNA (guanine(966)-N(2))-methyltransferase RsmD [Gammaproteobacteria bacterium]
MIAARPAPGRVRVIGGEWRRRWLPVPPDDSVRPTADRVRETLFNWLAPVLPGARCLDLFAGSGVLGIEAVSRGAAHATLVDVAPAQIARLRASIELLAAGSRIEVVHADARRLLAAAPPNPYDIVFVDPPYASGLAPGVLPLLGACWIAAGALIYVEQARSEPPIAPPEGWRMMREGATRQSRYALVRAPDGQAPVRS